MAFEPSKKTSPYSGETFIVTYTEVTHTKPATNFKIKKFDITDDSYSLSIVSTSDFECVVRVTVQPNTSTVEKVCSFYVIASYDGYPDTMYRYQFSVAYDTAKIVVPVWRDVYYTAEKKQSLNYTISVDGEIIYNGKSIAQPNQNGVLFNINRLCSNFLGNSIDSFESGYRTLNDYAKLFTIKEGNTTIAQYHFYNSYAYEDREYKYFLSTPIRRTVNRTNTEIIVDSRQYLMCSLFSEDINIRRINYNLITTKGITTTAIQVGNNAQWLIMDRGIDNNADAVLVNDGDKDAFYYNIQDTCYDYCLYYSNAYGGWDSLLIDANTKKTDKITSKYYTRDYDNTTIKSEKTKFANIINTEYVLHTGWFNDDEQSRLHHLLESTEVYLHNLNTDEIYPVNITNTTCEYKTFTNNGRKKFNNTINVEVAQEKLRR